MIPGVRAVVQRVKRASVRVSGQTVGEIGAGLLVLLGVALEDKEADAEYLARKVLALRIFDDAAGRMNVAIGDVGGAALVVSQFTLYGDARGQNRPSYVRAARPEQAQRLYEHLVEKLRAAGLRCETGRFQEMMEVELVNDGPVTILLDSEKTF
jgi:D-tyrosyl-tRNA(Tyr) deacylase